MLGGGNAVGSVQGTLEDALLGYFAGGDLANRPNVTGLPSIVSLEQLQQISPLTMSYAAVEYYASVSRID